MIINKKTYHAGRISGSVLYIPPRARHPCPKPRETFNLAKYDIARDFPDSEDLNAFLDNFEKDALSPGVTRRC